MLSSLFTSLLTIVGIMASSFAGVPGAFLAQVSTNAATSATIENVAPTIETINISGNEGAPSSSFERTISVSGFVNDQNGAGDVQAVSLVVWRTSNSLASSCTPDPNHCYRVISCIVDRNTGTITQAWYQCTFSVPQAYAYGTWYARVTGKDFDNATGTDDQAFFILPFSFEPPASTTPPTTPPTTIGYMPPRDDTAQQPTTPPHTPPSSAGTSATTTSGTTSESLSPTIAGTDCIAAFYARIEKDEPNTRHQMRHTEACDNSLRVAAYDTGLLVFDISDNASPTKETTRAVIVELSGNASSPWITLHTERLTAKDYPICLGTQTGNLGAQVSTCNMFDVTAVDDSIFRVSAKNATEETLTSLASPARITLIVPEDLSGKTIHVYRQNARGTAWEEVTALIASDAHTVTFHTSELGVFAILTIDERNIVAKEFSRLLSLFVIGGLLLILLAFILLALLGMFRRRNVALLQGPMRSSRHPHDPIVHNDPHTP